MVSRPGKANVGAKGNGRQFIVSDQDMPRGWVKPTRPRTIAEVKALITERQREVAALELELFNLQQGPRLEAIVQIRNIMRAQQLTVDDICAPKGRNSRNFSLAE